MSDPRTGWSDRQIAICMGLDVMRLMLGMPTKTFSLAEIVCLAEIICQDPSAWQKSSAPLKGDE